MLFTIRYSIKLILTMICFAFRLPERVAATFVSASTHVVANCRLNPVFFFSVGQALPSHIPPDQGIPTQVQVGHGAQHVSDVGRDDLRKIVDKNKTTLVVNMLLVWFGFSSNVD